MPILRLGQQIPHDRLKVSLETGFVFVDKHTCGCMQTEDAADTFFNAGFRHGIVKVIGDIQQLSGLRGRKSYRLHSFDFTIPHDSEMRQRRTGQTISASPGLQPPVYRRPLAVIPHLQMQSGCAIALPTETLPTSLHCCGLDLTPFQAKTHMWQLFGNAVSQHATRVPGRFKAVRPQQFSIPLQNSWVSG